MFIKKRRERASMLSVARDHALRRDSRVSQ